VRGQELNLFRAVLLSLGLIDIMMSMRRDWVIETLTDRKKPVKEISN